MRIVTLLLLALIPSCQPRPQAEPEPKQYDVPTEVEPYVQAFRAAAQVRGQTIAVDNLIITFGQPSGEDVCGECLLQAGKTPRIVLSAGGLCWKDANANERECLIFHELGHCLLGRGHLNSRFPLGMYTSLMNPNDISVYATCRYPIGGDECDKRPRQSYYHNELFDPKTPAPGWAN